MCYFFPSQYHRIASICKPHVFMNHIDSDWTVLKGMRVKHTNGEF